MELLNPVLWLAVAFLVFAGVWLWRTVQEDSFNARLNLSAENEPSSTLEITMSFIDGSKSVVLSKSIVAYVDCCYETGDQLIVSSADAALEEAERLSASWNNERPFIRLSRAMYAKSTIREINFNIR